MSHRLNEVFFPQLQVVRGLAALLVILNHIYSKKIFFKSVPVAKAESSFGNIGVIGLTLFFVLSGFLITYLLLNEKAITGTINVKKFYIRRILRIWPLYFLLILIGHFILPFIIDSNFEGGNMANDFWVKSIFYILILPNYALIIFKPHNPYIDVTWSIGVEEQFYLVWPQLIKSKKSLLLMIFTFITVQLLAEIFTHYAAFYKDKSKTVYILNEAVRFIEWTRAGYFAIGASGAIFYVEKSYESNKFINRLVKYSPWLFAAIFIAGTFWYFYLQFLAVAVCYSFFQLYLITKKSTESNFLFVFLEWLGKISYGLYLWHCIVIVFVFKAYDSMNFDFKNQQLASLVLYFIIIAITIIISWLSYTFFESFFLNLKNKYSILRTKLVL
jgi:peptidoglycan/LPS O-acetylase OafA/YrhL